MITRFHQCIACKAFRTENGKDVALRVHQLEIENARYRKALEKYANPETHSMDENGETWYGDYFDYKTARDALKDME